MARVRGWRWVWGVFFSCAMTSASLAQAFNTLVSFNYTDGAVPQTALVQGRDGNFYGTTSEGGAYGWGTVFNVTQSGTLTTLYSFCAKVSCSDGAHPTALILATDGNFYGTTVEGGADGGPCYNLGCGTIFKMTPEGDLTTLKAFSPYEHGVDGIGPYGLIQARNGSLYGPAINGGAQGHGTVFSLSPADNFEFWNVYPNGHGPNWLIQGADGNFYGLTFGGSGDTYGSIFRMTPSGTFTRVHRFSESDGVQPDALISTASGNFFGTTTYGGANNNLACNGNDVGCGTVFEITPAGKLTTLYSFCALSNCADGAVPVGVIQATDANFYGVAEGGGQSNNCCGTIFQITADGSFTSLYDFCVEANCPDGQVPQGGLLQATNGNFYGTTSQAGAYSDGGTVFSLSMGLSPFVSFVQSATRVAQAAQILGQGFTGTTKVLFNGISASFNVRSDTFLTATVPAGATTGYVTVTTPGGTLTSNVPFHVIP